MPTNEKTDKQNVVCNTMEYYSTYEGNPAIRDNIDELGGHYTVGNKPVTGGQTP